MSGRGRKDSKKQKKSPIKRDPEKKKRGRKESKTSGVKDEKSALATAEVKARIIREGAFQGPLAGKPSMIQSSYGKKGNFELVAPISIGGLAYYWRDNDQDDLPWLGPMKFDIAVSQEVHSSGVGAILAITADHGMRFIGDSPE